MANSTFEGPVRSEAGFTQVTISDTTGVETELEIVDSSGNLSAATFLRDAETAEHGAGSIGTSGFGAPQTRRWTSNGVITTQIKFDISGLAVKGDAANDVIGLSAGGVAYIGRYVVATYGALFKAELSCLEAPGEGTATITQDIDLAANSSAVLIYDGAASTKKLINSATLVANETVVNLIPVSATALAANDYIYIVEADTAATTGVYDAGMFLLTMYGHAVLA